MRFGIPLIALGITSFIGWLAFTIPRMRRRQAALRRLQGSTATTIADREVVTVVGVVRALGELVAPLSGAICVAHVSRAVILPDRGPRDPFAQNQEIVESKLVPFELVTAAGIVRIEGPEFELVMPTEPLIPRKLDREIEFLITHGSDPGVARRTGFDEARVEPGAKISVHGMAIVEIEPTADERGFREAPSRIRLVAHDNHPLTIGTP